MGKDAKRRKKRRRRRGGMQFGGGGVVVLGIKGRSPLVQGVMETGGEKKLIHRMR